MNSGDQGIGLRIRPYRATDGDTVLAMWREAGLDWPPDNVASDPASIAAGGDRTTLFVGEVDESDFGGQIVATLAAAKESQRGWVSHLAVRPSRQRQGIGSRMLRHAEAHLAAAGVLRTVLLIGIRDSAAWDFFTRQGYVIEGSRMMMGRQLDDDRERPSGLDRPAMHYTTWEFDPQRIVKPPDIPERPTIDLSTLNEEQALLAAVTDTIGHRISFTKMHEYITDIFFENAMMLRFELTGKFIHADQEVRIPQIDRAGIFGQLSKAYGHAVKTMQLSENYQLRTEFDNGFVFVVGSQALGEIGYEQFEIHHDTYGMFVVRTSDICWWSK